MALSTKAPVYQPHELTTERRINRIFAKVGGWHILSCKKLIQNSYFADEQQTYLTSNRSFE